MNYGNNTSTGTTIFRTICVFMLFFAMFCGAKAITNDYSNIKKENPTIVYEHGAPATFRYEDITIPHHDDSSQNDKHDDSLAEDQDSDYH